MCTRTWKDSNFGFGDIEKKLIHVVKKMHIISKREFIDKLKQTLNTTIADRTNSKLLNNDRNDANDTTLNKWRCFCFEKTSNLNINKCIYKT